MYSSVVLTICNNDKKKMSIFSTQALPICEKYVFISKFYSRILFKHQIK